MNWDYTREEEQRESAVTGKHRVVITEVTEAVTGPNSKKPGTPMIVIKFRPSGRKFTITHRIVDGPYFNRNMTQFFDSFPEIEEGNFNFISWVGCEGGAMLKADDRGYTQISYFLDPIKTSELPPFEGEKPQKMYVTSIEDETEDDDELPFV